MRSTVGIGEDSVTRNTKLLLMLTSGLIALAFVASACDIKLPVTDCSWIHQPDSGGLVCLGANVLALGVGVIALVLALAVGLGAAVPH